MTRVHMHRWQVLGIPGIAVAASVLLAVAFVAGAYGARAQGEGEAHLHPAHIHLGTCDELDPNPTFPLTDFTLPAADSGAEDAAVIPVEGSATTVDATLEDVRTGGYAINIHQSVEDIGTYIACGNLGGAIADGALMVGLGELNDSGHSGIVILAENGDQSEVNVYLAEGLSGAPEAAAASTTTEEDTESMTNATTVDIKDFAYVPDPIEIPAGATVTWTNSDTVPHTATAQDREALQSGKLNPGDTFSQTFDTPGTFDYFCEFHANMKGTLVVQ